MKINILFSSAVLALGLGSVAHAVTFTYNFTITGGNVSSIGPISGGSGSPTVTVTPYSWTGSELYSNSTNNSNTTGVHITQNASAGLGVLNSSDDGSSNVDNSGQKDMLLFSFSSSVSLSQITLGSVSGDSDFRYWIGDSASTADSLFGDGTGGTNVIGGSSPASYLIGGTGFNILVSSRPFQSNDSFRIKQLVVNNSVPDSGATFTLLGLGCLGLAGLKRRMSA